MIAIKSEEYVQKFIGITSSVEGDKLVAGYALKAILNNKGHDTEDAYFLNSKSGELISHYKLGELGGSIELPKLKKDEKLILIHNHPNSASFSFRDFVTTNNFPEIETMIAAGHDGTVYFLSVSEGKRLVITDNNEYNHYRNAWSRLYRDNGGDCGALTIISKELGWIYHVK